MSRDFDSEVFGPLVAIRETDIVCLALKVASKAFGKGFSGGSIISQATGSYNIIHIVQLEDIKLVIRIPATGWGAGLTDRSAAALKSQVATMRLIRRQSSIPVPEVYGFDADIKNEIGAPYICMSFLPGIPVAEAWVKKSAASAREKHRRLILTSLAETMAKFACLGSFDQIGSVTDADTGQQISGPCFTYHEKRDGGLEVEAAGPYSSGCSYLQRYSAERQLHTIWDKAEAKVMAVVTPCLPSPPSQGGFVLCLPDFDSQNILVNEEGKVTGLVDWDHAQTVPRYVGYARYPGWITRDWDPLIYGWPKVSEEDPPEALEQYRAHYNMALGNALNWQGDWALVANSHITEAVWNAARYVAGRTQICEKLIEAANIVQGTGREVLYNIGSGRYTEPEWDRLEAGLKRLFSAGTQATISRPDCPTCFSPVGSLEPET